MAVLALVSTASFAAAAEQLYVIQGDEVLILDSGNGRLIDSRDAAGADRIVITPGGKFVFMMNFSTGRGIAVDFEDAERIREINLEIHAPLDALTFSPQGDLLYVQPAAEDPAAVYSHSGGVLSSSESRVPEGSGRLAFNSRGTRIYRDTGSHLVYFLASDLSEIHRVPIDSDAGDWRMAPDGRNIWGRSPAGWHIVDEARRRVSAVLENTRPGEAHFSRDGRRVWALGNSGTTFVEADARRLKILRSIEIGFTAETLALSADRIWLTDGANLFYSSIATPEAPVSAGEIPGRGPIRDLAVVELKPGQGFACFR